MENQQANKYRDFLTGLLMHLLLLPEFILFVTVGSESVQQNPIGIVSFFAFLIALYTTVPLLLERKIPIESQKESSTKSTFYAIAIALLFTALKTVFYKQEQPKFVSEYSGFIQSSGIIGIIGATLQHLYYFAEMVLSCYMLRAFQKAGETIFNRKNIPYGGILLGVLWGFIVHTISQGISVGLYMFVISIVWGIIYLVAKKNRWLTYFLMTIMFIC